MLTARSRGVIVAVAVALASAGAAGESLRAGQTRPFRLEPDGHAAYTVALPAGPVALVLDARRSDAVAGSLAADVSVTDPDGAFVHHASLANDLEVEHRAVTHFDLTKTGTVTVDVANAAAATDYWLTIGAGRFVPLFGDHQPLNLDSGGRQTGRLDKSEHAYFVTSFAPGDYDAALEFANPNGYVTRLAGALTLLDAEGETVQPLVRLDATDVRTIARGTFSVSRGGTFLFKVYNAGGPTDEYYRTDFTLTLSSR